MKSSFGFAFCLTVFTLLALSVHGRWWVSFDWSVLIVLQATLSRAVDVPFSLLSLLGSAEMTLLIFLALVWRARAAQRWSLSIAFALVAVFEIAGKVLVAQPETPDAFVRYAFPSGMPSGKISTGLSFPSGHMARTMFIVILLMQMLSTSRWNSVARTLGYATAISIAGLMFLSRIYLADHWFSDVLGGALLGGAWAIWGWQARIEPLPRSVRKFFSRETS